MSEILWKIFDISSRIQFHFFFHLLYFWVHFSLLSFLGTWRSRCFFIFRFIHHRRRHRHYRSHRHRHHHHHRRRRRHHQYLLWWLVLFLLNHPNDNDDNEDDFIVVLSCNCYYFCVLQNYFKLCGCARLTRIRSSLQVVRWTFNHWNPMTFNHWKLHFYHFHHNVTSRTSFHQPSHYIFITIFFINKNIQHIFMPNHSKLLRYHHTSQSTLT